MIGTLTIDVARTKQADLVERARLDRCCGRGALPRKPRARRLGRRGEG